VITLSCLYCYKIESVKNEQFIKSNFKKMNFDGALDISGSLCCWSPNGRFLAVVASRARLVVRDAKSLDVIFSELCPSVSSASRSSHLTSEETKIDKIAFSTDSVFVYASSFKAGITHVFQVSITEPILISVWTLVP